MCRLVSTKKTKERANNNQSVFRLFLDRALSSPSSISTSLSPPSLCPAFSPFIFRVWSLFKSCLATWIRPRRSPISSTSIFFLFFPSPFSTSCFFSLGRFIACFITSASASWYRRSARSSEGPMGTSSTRGILVPDARSLIV